MPGGALASVRTSDRAGAVPLLRRSQGGNVLMVAGVPLDLGGSLDDRLSRAVAGDYHAAADELQALDGAFAAVFWDAANRKLAIVTDALGLQPLYIARPGGGLLLASELKAMPASGLVDVEMDLAGWGAFVGFGFPVGDGTQLAGVRRADPGAVMLYDPASGSLESSTYWQWPEVQTDLTLATVDTGRLIDALGQELAAYGQHAVGGTVLLSGGFDSRLTLALLGREGWDVDALILAHQDELWGADGKLAARTARRLGVKYELIRTPRSYYSTRPYLDYLVMNEVTTPSLYLFISQVSAYLREEMRAVWDGTPPGYGLVPAFLPAGGFDVLLGKIQRRRDAYAWRVADRLFGAEKAGRMYDALNEAVRAETAKYPDDEAGVTRFEVMNRMRRRTLPNCLKVYSNVALPFVLGVSRAFWDYAGAIPYAVSGDYRMYHLIFRRHFPRVADIPFLSGGGLWCDAEQGVRGRLAMARHRLATAGGMTLAKKAYRRWVRRSRGYWADSACVGLLRERMEMDHDDIDADGARALDIEARLPFYWQMWRWIMQGKLTTENTDTFLQRLPVRGGDAAGRNR